MEKLFIFHGNHNEFEGYTLDRMKVTLKIELFEKQSGLTEFTFYYPTTSNNENRATASRRRHSAISIALRLQLTRLR